MARPEADLRVTRGYISAKIWAQAIEAAGTTDGVAVAQALHAGTFRVFGIEARFDAYGNMEARSESPLFGSPQAGAPGVECGDPIKVKPQQGGPGNGIN